jgi:ribosomal protein S19E (S16A)
MYCCAVVLNSAASSCQSVEKEVLHAIHELKIFLEHRAPRMTSEWGRCLMRKLAMEVIMNVQWWPCNDSSDG